MHRQVLRWSPYEVHVLRSLLRPLILLLQMGSFHYSVEPCKAPCGATDLGPSKYSLFKVIREHLPTSSCRLRVRAVYSGQENQVISSDVRQKNLQRTTPV